MKSYEFEYLINLVSNNIEMAENLQAHMKTEEVIRKRAIEVLIQNIEYHGEITLETLLRGYGFPMKELVDILNIDLFEVKEAIEKHNEKVKED